MQERRIDLGDGWLTVLEAGSGGRPLLLVHGFTGAKEDFSDHAEELAAQGWWVVAPDLPGHGASHHPEAEEDYSLRFFADVVWQLVDELGWTRLVLLGHSMGGMIVQIAALDRPEALAGLILMDTSHGAVQGLDRDMLEFGAAIARQEGMASVKAVLDSLADGGPLGTEAYERVCRERPGHREAGDRKLLGSSPAMYASLLVGIDDQADRLGALAGLDMPTLVLVGDQDTPFLTQSAAMAETMPNATLAVLPDAGHSPQYENPSAWADAMRDFLAGVDC